MEPTTLTAQMRPSTSQKPQATTRRTATNATLERVRMMGTLVLLAAMLWAAFAAQDSHAQTGNPSTLVSNRGQSYDGYHARLGPDGVTSRAQSFSTGATTAATSWNV